MEVAIEQIPVEVAIEQIPVEVATEQIPMEVPSEHVVQATAASDGKTPEIEGEELEVVCEKQKTRLETSPRSKDNFKKRHQNIVDIVSHWDFSSKPLTIEDICEKPFNKLNMARAFNDLLTLCNKKFIRLQTREDSTELSHILKGPRLEKAE